MIFSMDGMVLCRFHCIKGSLLNSMCIVLHKMCYKKCSCSALILCCSVKHYFLQTLFPHLWWNAVSLDHHFLNGTGHFVHIFIPTCWNPSFCQNMIIFHQNIDGNMTFMYSLIIIDHGIREETSNLTKNEVKREIYIKSTYGQILPILSKFSL